MPGGSARSCRRRRGRCCWPLTFRSFRLTNENVFGMRSCCRAINCAYSLVGALGAPWAPLGRQTPQTQHNSQYYRGGGGTLAGLATETFVGGLWPSASTGGQTRLFSPLTARSRAVEKRNTESLGMTYKFLVLFQNNKENLTIAQQTQHLKEKREKTLILFKNVTQDHHNCFFCMCHILLSVKFSKANL